MVTGGHGHTHSKECEELRAARDALRAQLSSPNVRTSPIDATIPRSDVVTGPIATHEVEAELATVEAALREAHCDYATH